MKVRLDPRAVRDLEDIRAYLIEHSPSGAERVRQHIVQTIERLGDFPLLGRTTHEPGVRVLPLTRYPYLIFYAVNGYRGRPPRSARRARTLRRKWSIWMPVLRHWPSSG